MDNSHVVESMTKRIYTILWDANPENNPLPAARYMNAEPPRAVGGQGANLTNEAPCERSEQKIFSITPFRLALKCISEQFLQSNC